VRPVDRTPERPKRFGRLRRPTRTPDPEPVRRAPRTVAELVAERERAAREAAEAGGSGTQEAGDE
jgi:hypothetical protein